MNKLLCITGCLTILLTKNAAAQYYYKDIVSNEQARTEKKVWEEKKIRDILVHSFEGDGKASEGFYCEKKINKNYSNIETYTKSNITGKSLVTSVYNDKGLLVQSTDSSDIAVSNTIYEYDDNNHVKSITSYTSSSDDDFKTSLTETHQYFYNDKGQPVKMLRIKNSRDSVQVDFIIDEKGNVTDEIEPGIKGHHYYYYYDDKNRLTDIVRYNVIKKELRPDFVFEYDDEGHVTQMVSVEDGAGNDYYTWKYVYNDGLRIIEKCFSKEKTLLGYFEYEYD